MARCQCIVSDTQGNYDCWCSCHYPSRLFALYSKCIVSHIHSETTIQITHSPATIPAVCLPYVASGKSGWPEVCLLVGCLTSQQHASVSQGRICSDKYTCCQGKNPLYRRTSPQRRIESTTLHQAGKRAQHTTNQLVPRQHVCLLVGCLTSQQHASVSQGRICTDKFTCCHTEIEAADQTFHLTQSQYTDTGPTSPSADPITPGAWQGSHWSANV